MLDQQQIQNVHNRAQALSGMTIDANEAQQYVQQIFPQLEGQQTDWLKSTADKYAAVAGSPTPATNPTDTIHYALTAATAEQLIEMAMTTEAATVSTEAATAEMPTTTSATASVDAGTGADTETNTNEANTEEAAQLRTTRDELYDQLGVPPQMPIPEARKIAEEQGKRDIANQLLVIEARLNPGATTTAEATSPTAEPTEEAQETTEAAAVETPAAEPAEVATPEVAEESTSTVTEEEMSELGITPVEEQVETDTTANTPEPATQTVEQPATAATAPAAQPAPQAEAQMDTHHTTLSEELAALKTAAEQLDDLTDNTEDALEAMEETAREVVSGMKESGDDQVNAARAVRVEIAETEIELTEVQQRIGHIQELLKHLKA